MEEYELRRAKDCICNIQDKLDALRSEIYMGKPYAYYCLEKLEPIKNDVNCLISMFGGKKEEIEAICHIWLLDTIFDTFGKNVTIKKISKDDSANSCISLFFFFIVIFCFKISIFFILSNL